MSQKKLKTTKVEKKVVGAYKAVENADALLLLTEWNEFRSHFCSGPRA